MKLSNISVSLRLSMCTSPRKQVCSNFGYKPQRDSKPFVFILDRRQEVVHHTCFKFTILGDRQERRNIVLLSHSFFLIHHRALRAVIFHIGGTPRARAKVTTRRGIHPNGVCEQSCPISQKSSRKSGLEIGSFFEIYWENMFKVRLRECSRYEAKLTER